MRVLPVLGVSVVNVAVVAGASGPRVVVLVAVGFEAATRALEEAGEGVAVPFLECVGVEGVAGAAALVGEDGDLVDEVGVFWPAGRDRAVGVPGVFVVDPDDDGIEPGPQVGAQVRVSDRGRVPGFRKQGGVPDCGLLA